MGAANVDLHIVGAADGDCGGLRSVLVKPATVGERGLIFVRHPGVSSRVSFEGGDGQQWDHLFVANSAELGAWVNGFCCG